MKKWLKIVLWVLLIIVLFGLGFYFRYQTFYLNDEMSLHLRGTCGCSDIWECPDWFLEEKNINLNNYFRGVLTELPEGGEKAGCKERFICWPCSDMLN